MHLIGIILALSAMMQAGPSDSDKIKMWVYFSDKTHEICNTDIVKCHLLPPDHRYTSSLDSLGVDIVKTSNWLNAVSVLADSSQARLIRTLHYVTDVQPVLRLLQARATESNASEYLNQTASQSRFSSRPDMRISVYGESAEQLQFHRVDKVHALGYDGSGVIVGIMDGGFDVSHEVFEHMRSTDRILAERDFVDGGNDTKVNVIDPLYHSHGTSVGAIIAGKKDGTLMGVAPGVSFVLARTEDDQQEAPVEEDNWVAAIEWMQTLGVQVVNSSLGYSIFTSQPSASYSYDDMDGKTSAVAQAATKAASLFNMVVVTSAGNEGNSVWKYITTPADADSILAVGSVTSAGDRISSSSMGPTADGRIKPDVSARGHKVFSAKSSPSNSYGYVNGTSFAAPHVAGMMALALQARPGMPAIWYVRQAQMASSLYTNPNNLIGYGIIDAFDLISGITTSMPEDATPSLPDDVFLIRNYPNPFNPSTSIYYEVPEGWRLEQLFIYDVAGRLVAVLPTTGTATSGAIQWSGYNRTGMKAASGIYFAQFQFANGAAFRHMMHPMSLIK